MIPHQVGDVVLMEWHGWLKAFRVEEVHVCDEGHVSYALSLIEREPA